MDTRKLTDDMVRTIRAYKSVSIKELAKHYQVSETTIRNVRNYKTYRDVPDIMGTEKHRLDNGSQMCYNVYMFGGDQGMEEFNQDDAARALLRPLLNGDTVLLAVSSRGMMRKKRILNPFLIIAPGKKMGLDDNVLLFALPGYGAEIMEIRNLKATWLFRLGLNMAAAKLLVKALNELFNPVN